MINPLVIFNPQKVHKLLGEKNLKRVSQIKNRDIYLGKNAFLVFMTILLARTAQGAFYAAKLFMPVTSVADFIGGKFNVQQLLKGSDKDLSVGDMGLLGVLVGYLLSQIFKVVLRIRHFLFKIDINAKGRISGLCSLIMMAVLFFTSYMASMVAALFKVTTRLLGAVLIGLFVGLPEGLLRSSGLLKSKQQTTWIDNAMMDTVIKLEKIKWKSKRQRFIRCRQKRVNSSSF